VERNFAEMKNSKDQLIDQIDNMEPEKVQKVLEFARALSGETKGVRGELLLQFSGRIDLQDLDMMTSAIIEECEKITANDW
jgi:hypothetical protein